MIQAFGDWTESNWDERSTENKIGGSMGGLEENRIDFYGHQLIIVMVMGGNGNKWIRKGEAREVDIKLIIKRIFNYKLKKKKNQYDVSPCEKKNELTKIENACFEIN